jgi:hypothetical protein
VIVYLLAAVYTVPPESLLLDLDVFHTLGILGTFEVDNNSLGPNDIGQNNLVEYRIDMVDLVCYDER